MGRFGRRDGDVVAGRAYVVPSSTGNVGTETDGNVNNLGHRGAAKSSTLLVLRWVEDGGPMPADAQQVVQPLSNWLRYVMHSAGSNDELGTHLPAELFVPVWVDRSSRRIVRLDIDAAEAELEPYHELAKQEWKETEAPLAAVRGAVALPGMALRGAKSLAREWRGALSSLKRDMSADGTPREPTAEETEALRRTAVALGYQLEQNPKQHAQVRASALQAGAIIAEATRDGSYGIGNFENWIMLQTLSRVITPEEEAEYRRIAGMPPAGQG